MPVYFDVAKIMRKKGLQANGPVQRFFTHTVKIEADEFVPFEGGDLATNVEEGPDYLIYESPYASYHFFGERKDGSHKINEANRNREYHELATSRWDKAMWTAKKEQIIKEVANKINHRGGY